MEDRVTEPMVQRTNGGSTFSYAPPPSKEEGVRRQNMWKAAGDEPKDRQRYTELMEDKAFHADKGAVSGELLPRSAGIGAPAEKLQVSAEFIAKLTSDSQQAEKRARPVESRVVGNMYEVVQEDPEALLAWQKERDARQAQEDAKAAKRRKKRDKKKGRDKGGQPQHDDPSVGGKSEAPSDEEPASATALGIDGEQGAPVKARAPGASIQGDATGFSTLLAIGTKDVSGT